MCALAICSRCKLLLRSSKIGNISAEGINIISFPGLPLRGDGDETDSNLHQLLFLRGEDYPPIHQFPQRQQLKYTAHEVQNELLSIMAQ